MNKTNVFFIIIGILIGWCTVPSLNAEADNGYKALLHKMIDITTQVEVNTALIAENTKAIREHLGAK